MAESNSTDLNGLCVLLTRPAGQQGELAAAIATGGGKAVSLPLLEIAPLPFPDSIKDKERSDQNGNSSPDCIEDDEAVLQASQNLSRQIMDLDRFQTLIFVSSNAARFGLDWIDQYWPQFPVGINVVAIGPSTAALLRENLQCRIWEPQSGMTSEAVLELSVLQGVAGQRVGIMRGVGGRDVLAQTLKSRGAQVELIELYHRRNVVPPKDKLETLCRDSAVAAVSILSGQTLQNYVDGLGEDSELYRLPLLVPSARVANLARDAGFVDVIDCEGADADAVLKGLSQIAGRSG
jgi:uroporphyrinogen-III synthase